MGGVLNSFEKYRAIWGIAAIVSQYRDMGPLSTDNRVVTVQVPQLALSDLAPWPHAHTQKALKAVATYL